MGSIDAVFAQLTLTSNPWASTLAGLFLIVAITFIAIKVFGEKGVEIGAYGFSVIVFLATLLATTIGLLPWYYLIIFLIVSLVAILWNKIFGDS